MQGQSLHAFLLGVLLLSQKGKLPIGSVIVPRLTFLWGRGPAAGLVLLCCKCFVD
jgi:hypothetical protein